MHGQFPRQIEDDSSMESTYGWMRTAGLKAETEALIVAAQDQALNTKCHKAKILQTSNDPKCRMCKQQDETVSHILSGCAKMAQTEYLKRHNNVAAAIHREICNHYSFPINRRPWLHQPDTITEDDQVKILWDMEVQTDRLIPSRRPDIVVVDKTKTGSYHH